MIFDIIVTALSLGAIYSSLGIGYSLVYKASGLVTLCQGEFLMLGAFIGLTLYKDLGVPLVLTFLIVAVCMFLIGFIVERYMIAVLVHRGATLAAIMLCTLAVSMMFQNGAQLVWTTSVVRFPNLFSQVTLRIGPFKVAPEVLLELAVAIVSTLGLHLFMTKTRFGTSMRAASLDAKAASVLGINVPITKGVTWGLAASLAGVVGCVIGPINGVYATMAAVIGSKGFASAVTGGYGNIYGAILGGLFFGLLEAVSTAYVSSVYRDVITFTILILILIVMPTGITKADVAEH